MIRFKKIEMEDFGPYRGIQSLEFERDSGVWIVYGDNGRGKTSLLNAFRYALYGTMLGRISEIEPKNMVNRLSRRANDGVGSMRVTVDMVVHGGEAWEVTRIYDEEGSPEESLIVSVDGETKTAGEGRRKLRSILPSELSDFFLFDGEDLRQYEYLLEEDSAAADELKDAIERVLGLPTLRQASVALEEINSEVTKKVADHMKRHDRTREAGQALEDAQELLDEYREDLKREKKRLQKRKDEKEGLEGKLEEHELAQGIMERLEVLRNERDSTKETLNEAEKNLREVTSSELWKAVLKSRAEDKIDDLEDEEHELRRANREGAFAEEVKKRLSASPGRCPVCGDNLSDKHRQEITERLHDASSDEVDGSMTDIREVSEKKRLLQQIVSSAERQVLLDREQRVDGLRLELRKKEDEIQEKEDDLDELGKDESEIRNLKNERDKRVHQIGNIEDRIENIKEDIREQKNVIPDLKAKANRELGEVDPGIKALEDISESMAKLFDEASEAYRERVRHNIENESSKLFVRISSEDDYEALTINDNYGLSIIDETGNPVPNRSAGYEHLVAFSLLAALQSYSPNRGPVVVDSPFQRLDEDNTRLVMGALPDMATQAMLLVFEKQFDRGAAIEALGDDLVEEYQLERESSKETRLTVREE